MWITSMYLILTLIVQVVHDWYCYVHNIQYRIILLTIWVWMHVTRNNKRPWIITCDISQFWYIQAQLWNRVWIPYYYALDLWWVQCNKEDSILSAYISCCIIQIHIERLSLSMSNHLITNEGSCVVKIIFKIVFFARIQTQMFENVLLLKWIKNLLKMPYIRFCNTVDQ